MTTNKNKALKELYPHKTTIASIFEEDLAISDEQLDIVYEYIDEFHYKNPITTYSNKTSYYQYFQDMTINEIEKHIALILLQHS